MRVTLETEDGKSFDIQVDSLDIATLKRTIFGRTRIPIDHQVLFFEGRILDNINGDDFVSTPTFQLQILKPMYKRGLRITLANLFINLPQHSYSFLYNVDSTISVFKLKRELVKKLKTRVPLRLLGLYRGNSSHALQDAKHLHDYGVKDGSWINVFLEVPNNTPSTSLNSERLNVEVHFTSRIQELRDESTNNVLAKQLQTPSGSSNLKMKIHDLTLDETFADLNLEVDLTDKVEVLRDELEKLQVKGEFEDPQDGYFFMKKLNESESFLWNGVRVDDEILIIKGTDTFDVPKNLS